MGVVGAIERLVVSAVQRIVRSARDTPTGLGVAALVATLLIAIAPLLAARQIEEPADQAAVRAMALYLTGVDDTDRLLADVGYTCCPPMDRALWDEFSPTKKIAAAYRSAERAERGAGSRLLALLARSLALQYGAVRWEQTLSAYLLDTGPLREVSFVAPSAISEPPIGIPVPIRNQILAIARYASGGAFGGVGVVLQQYFNLTPQQSFEILESSGSIVDALESGYREMMIQESPGIVNRALSRLVQETINIYAAAREEPAFASFVGSEVSSLSQVEATRPERAVARRSAATARYTDFLAEHYGSSARRVFREMTGRRAGFGGIIFGAPVQGVFMTTSPERVLWTPREPAGWGTLSIYFEDSTVAHHGPVRESDIQAARGLLLRPDDDVAIEPDEGVGLVSLVRRGLENDFDVVLHPALVDHPVGRSAVLVDSLPLVDRTGFFPALHLDTPTWKFSDRPVWVTVQGSDVHVTADPDLESEGDPRFLSWIPFSRSNEVVFHGAAEDSVTFDLQSDDFDAVLVARRGALSWFNDDGGPGQHARLTLQLPEKGEYELCVGSYGFVSNVRELFPLVWTHELCPDIESVWESEMLGVASRESGSGDYTLTASIDDHQIAVAGTFPGEEVQGGRLETVFRSGFQSMVGRSSDMRRLNDFARVFALVRGIHFGGGTWVGWPDRIAWTDADRDDVGGRRTPQRVLFGEFGEVMWLVRPLEGDGQEMRADNGGRE